jgi:hypothetical protein
MTVDEYNEYKVLKKRKNTNGLTDKEAARYARLKTKRLRMKEAEEANKSKTTSAKSKLTDAEIAHKLNKKLRNTEVSSIDELVDLEDLAKQVIESGFNADVLNKDVVDLPVAPNVASWVYDSRFMGYDSIWAWQLQTLTRLFMEWCTECTDPDWMQPVLSQRGVKSKYLSVDSTYGQFLERVQLYEFGVCPKCKGRRNQQHAEVNYELTACVGQRSGKSVVTGLAACYVMHRYLLINNPFKTYGIARGQPVYMTFCAYTLQQAIETVWDAFTSQYSQSPWFKSYNDSLIESANKQGVDHDVLFRVKDTYIWYGTKMLTASPAAADMKSLRGRTRLFGAVDELGWFGVGDAVKANGRETLEALNKSLQTIRSAVDSDIFENDPNALTAFMVNVSSPSSAFDPIMVRLRDAQKDPRIVTVHLSTWEAHPKITRLSLKGAEMTNYVEFMRDFGATPPLTDSPFMESEKLIDRCIYQQLKPTLRYQTNNIVDPIGGQYVGVKLIDIEPSNFPHIIVADAGETGNSFAVGIFHLEAGDENISDYVVIDGLVEIAPEKNTSTGEVFRVHFPSVFDLIMAICEKVYVKGVYYDRWNSAGEIQRLREKKINAERYSPVTTDFLNLRNRIYAGGLKIPRMEKETVQKLDITNPQEVKNSPITHFVLQLKTVRASGNKVLKPIAGEDDMFRTLVSASAIMEDNRVDYLTDISANKSHRVGLGRVMGQVYRRSTGTNNAGSNSRLGTVKVHSR